jgi:hypothetical protein
MPEVKMFIKGKERMIGAMVKAIAVEISGFQSVKGTTKEFLNQYGYYVFNFPSPEKAGEFKDAVRYYFSKYTKEGKE